MKNKNYKRRASYVYAHIQKIICVITIIIKVMMINDKMECVSRR